MLGEKIMLSHLVFPYHLFLSAHKKISTYFIFLIFCVSNMIFHKILFYCINKKCLPQICQYIA